MKGKKLQPRILYPERISFRFDREIKSFTDKQKLREFSSVQSLNHVRFFVTPWTAACQASLSITNSQSLLKFMSTASVMPSNHLIFCWPLLLPLLIGSYISIITINANGLNAPTKTYTDWVNKNMCVYTFSLTTSLYLTPKLYVLILYF